MHRIPVRQIMTSPPITIRPEAQVADAGEMMDEYRIRRLPVVDEEGCLLGIITDSDVLEAETAGSVLNSYDPDADESWLTVEEIMTTDVITVTPDETVGQLVIKLMENKVGGLPVVVPDADDAKRMKVIGVISETDIYEMIAEAWRQEEHERLMDTGSRRIRVIAQKRGLDWDVLSEDERNQMIDDILHEDKTQVE